MNLVILPFDKEAHLPLVIKWWEWYYEGDQFPDYCIPGNGVLALYDGQPVGVIFLYINDSKMAHLAFPIINPDVSVRQKLEILSELVEGGIKFGKQKLGEKAVIFAITHNNSVGSALKKSGFVDNGTMKTFALSIGDADIEFLE